MHACMQYTKLLAFSHMSPLIFFTGPFYLTVVSEALKHEVVHHIHCHHVWCFYFTVLHAYTHNIVLVQVGENAAQSSVTFGGKCVQGTPTTNAWECLFKSLRNQRSITCWYAAWVLTHACICTGIYAHMTHCIYAHITHWYAEIKHTQHFCFEKLLKCTWARSKCLSLHLPSYGSCMAKPTEVDVCNKNEGTCATIYPKLSSRGAQNQNASARPSCVPATCVAALPTTKADGVVSSPYWETTRCTNDVMDSAGKFKGPTGSYLLTMYYSKADVGSAVTNNDCNMPNLRLVDMRLHGNCVPDLVIHTLYHAQKAAYHAISPCIVSHLNSPVLSHPQM